MSRVSRASLFVGISLVLLGTGCDGCTGKLVSHGDGGPTDGGALDGATPDGAATDLGPRDGAIPDAALEDGALPDDGAVQDAALDDASIADGAVPDAALVDGGPVVCAVVHCGSMLYACGDCLDNDGDGLIDSEDPDCLGPCHNNEAGFYPMIPGGGGAPCKLDCYYDSNSGSGDDNCEWDARCDPLEPELDCRYTVPAPPDAHCLSEQPPACLDFCMPRTPNGCDCFGCCELPAGSGSWVYLGTIDASGTATCTLDAVSDPVACRACTPHPTCVNTCGRCELCLGRDPSTIPADCFPPPPVDGGVPDASVPPSDAGTPTDGAVPPTDAGTPTDAGPPPPPRCDSTHQPCGLPGDAVCPASFYCLTGCCTFFG